jgi:ABC-type sulfate/molybdate transport systems ATPase subunit
MWDVITGARSARSIILTTHLMEEASALCSRIGIMVSGRLACLGSSQHLKSKFGQGYLLEAKVADPSREAELLQFVHTLSPGAVVNESHHGHVKFSLPQVRCRRCLLSCFCLLVAWPVPPRLAACVVVVLMADTRAVCVRAWRCLGCSTQ